MEMHEDLHPHSLLICTLAQLPKEVGGHHPWRCSQSCGDVALRDVGGGHGGVGRGWTWGPERPLTTLMIL